MACLARRLFLPVAAVLALCLMASQVSALALLRPQATVEGPIIVLGDLFEGAGELAKRQIGAAPAPGQRAFYTISQVAAVARAHGLRWSALPHLKGVEVVREGRLISRDEITDAVRRAFQASGYDPDYRIRVEHLPTELFVPRDQPAELTVQNLEFDPRSRRFLASLVVTAKKGAPQRRRIAGQAFRTVEIPVLAHALSAGDILTAGALEWVETRADRLARHAQIDPEQLLGMAAKRTLRPGNPLRARDFAAPVLVRKGTLVTMVVKTAGMTLSAQGRALEDGARGQAILVSNAKSKRSIQATVTGPDRVRVPHAVTSVAAGSSLESKRP